MNKPYIIDEAHLLFSDSAFNAALESRFEFNEIIEFNYKKDDLELSAIYCIYNIYVSFEQILQIFQKDSGIIQDQLSVALDSYKWDPASTASLPPYRIKHGVKYYALAILDSMNKSIGNSTSNDFIIKAKNHIDCKLREFDMEKLWKEYISSFSN